MVVFHKWFRNKSLSTQFAICNIMITSLLYLIIGLQYQLHLSFLMPLMVLSSKQSLNTIIKQKSNLMLTFLDQKSNQLMALHQLSLQGQQQIFNGSDEFEYNYQYTKIMPPSIWDTTPVFVYAPMTNSFMCAQNRTKFNVSDIDRQQIIGFSNFMGVVGQMFNTQIFGVDQFSYGVMFTDPQILFSYPCLHRGAGFQYYEPHTRPWYIKAEEIYNTLDISDKYVQFTDPYIFAENSIDVSLVVPQVDRNNKFIGAWAIDFSGSIFTQYIQTQDMIDKVLLVTRDGILLVHNFENKDRIVPLYIYNETVTGYSKNDWERIMYNSDLNNNCNKQYSIPGYFCKYNTKIEKDLHVLSSYIQKYELYIVLITDQTINEEIIKKENQHIADFISNEFSLFINRSVSIFISHTLVTILIISITVIKPIERVICLINKYLHPNQENCIAQYRLLIQAFNSIDVQKLLRAFNALLGKVTQSQLKKSKTCQLIEKFRYFRRQKYFRIPFSKGYKQCQDVNPYLKFQSKCDSMQNWFNLITNIYRET